MMSAILLISFIVLNRDLKIDISSLGQDTVLQDNNASKTMHTGIKLPVGKISKIEDDTNHL